MALQPTGKPQNGVSSNNAFVLNFGPVLENAFQKGYTVSLYGPVGAGKTIFCENMARCFLNGGAECIYISTERTPADIRIDLATLKVNVDKLEAQRKLTFVDGYSWLVGSSAETYRVENLANLSELTATIEKACADLDHDELVILDSVSPLCLHNPEEDVTKFLQLFAAKNKGRAAIGITVVQEGVHSSKFYNTLAYTVDGMFDLRKDEQDSEIKRYFRIRNLRSCAHSAEWIPFTIEPDRDFKLENRPT